MNYSIIGSLILEIIIVCVIYYRWFRSDEKKDEIIKDLENQNFCYIQENDSLHSKHRDLIRRNSAKMHVISSQDQEIKKLKESSPARDLITGKYKKRK